MKLKLSFLLLLMAVVASSMITYSQNSLSESKMMTQPAVSKNHIAFVYANDLWIADQNGQNIKRLTVDKGIESRPNFSPDGKWIVFSAQYDGNTDVFIIPVEGGIPKRLTYHPSADLAVGFSRDGKSVLFVSQRNIFSARYLRMFSLPLTGGFPQEVNIPNIYTGSFSPDDSYIAYNPLAPVFQQWKNYRGGTMANIWIMKFKDYSIEKIPQPKGGCNDINPMWIGDKIYFLSDREGEFNLYSFGRKNPEIKKLTNYKDFPILNCSADNDKIIYEQAGILHLFDIKTEISKKITLKIDADLPHIRPTYVKGNSYMRWGNISPTGMRAVVEMRGEIITIPAEKGDPRNITNSVAVHDRTPAWSPDGKSIAYFSDESGEYALHVAPQNGKGEIKKYKLNGSGFYEYPIWSPDNQKISFRDNSLTLYYIDLKSGNIKKIASEVYYAPGPLNTIKGEWSPDSKWMVYTSITKSFMQIVYFYSLDKEQSFAVTDGMSEVSNPVFDKSGKYIYFLSSTDAGPVKQWFDMSNADMEMSSSVYMVCLKKDSISPLAKESDEEKVAENKDAKTDKKPDDKSKKESNVIIDFEDINDRILSLPIPSGKYSDLKSGNEGELYFIERTQGPDAKLHKFDLKKRKDETIIEKVTGYEISFDRSKILYSASRSWFIASTTGKIEPGKGKLNLESVEISADPVKEWKQIYDEAWRINRDYFYDPNMHGADWKGLKEKYSEFLPYLTSRNDLNRLIQWLCSELSVGHHRGGGGDQFFEVKNVPVGLLGADYVIDKGRYKFSKVFGGLNWTPELKSPLTEPGVNVKAGEYLLEVNGIELKSTMNIFSLFENMVDKIVELKVGPNPDGIGSRIVKVTPIRDEYSLRNRDWVEGNMNKVHKATDGKVAYVYVPNTTNLGHTYFKRYFFPQADKQAIIVDERFNGGGQIADYYIDILRRPYVSHWATRYGEDYKSPGGSILGPKVLITDETAGSGGDLFPWMWKKNKLGPIVGKTTWGGLVGILGFPVLLDGGTITAPNIGIWTEDGFVVENEGVAPDIEVEQLPAEVIKGKDPQLDRAIQIVMDELKKNPPKEPKRPPFPIKVRK